MGSHKFLLDFGIVLLGERFDVFCAELDGCGLSRLGDTVHSRIRVRVESLSLRTVGVREWLFALGSSHGGNLLRPLGVLDATLDCG